MRARSTALVFFVVLMGPAAIGLADDLQERIRSLLATLETRDSGVGIDELVAIGSPAVPPLVAAAREGGRRGGRACEALARIGTPEALDAAYAVARAEDFSLRQGAVEALAHVPSQRSLGVLAEALRANPVRRVRQSAVVSLGRIASEAALPAILTALEDEWEWVRAEAVTALGRMAAPQAAASLVEALSDASWEVRLRARRALVAIGLPAVAPLARAASDPAPGLRWRVAWTLGQIGNDEALRILEGKRDDPDWRVRNEVAAAAGRRNRVEVAGFPTFAGTGLHSTTELEQAVTITGRSIAEITDLGRPGGLSSAGFMAEDEDVQSVLLGDNRLVAALGLTHPQMARPLLHVWHRIEADAEGGRWDMAAHRWNQGPTLSYEGREILVEAHDTKGGQESIFDDGLQGAFWIRIRRDVTSEEAGLLRRRYGHLSPERWAVLVERLSTIQTGEIQPHYVLWYGFYEGHTEWRVDPIAIAFVFGLRTLAEIEAAFPGRLDETLTAHFTR